MYHYEQSAKLSERAKKSLAGGVSSEFRKYSYPHALFYSEASGVYLHDVDGNRYLDFALSQGPMLVGHSHPYVLEKITEYSAKGQLFAGQQLKEVELAERLQKYIPSAELMRFCLDGSTAVQTAFRVARAKTGRQKFIRFEGHYHGWLDNVAWGLTLGEQAMGDRGNPNAVPWSEGLARGSRDEFIVLPWNDLGIVRRTLEKFGSEVAAIITEPIMCNSSCIQPKEGFLKGLRDLSDQYGIALIFDEVITGFRTSLGGAQKFYNVIPDISIFGKALASGYPISAVVGKRYWMEPIAEGKVIHAGTMNAGNPSVAAALATLDVLAHEGTHDRIFALGKRLMAGLKNVANEIHVNLLVQGLGPMLHTGFADVEQVNDFRDMKYYDKAKLNLFVAGLHNRGVRIIGRGLWYISAVHTENEIDHAVAMARETLKELS